MAQILLMIQNLLRSKAKREKKGDKSATAAALEEVESLNHVAAAPSPSKIPASAPPKNTAPTKATSTLQQDSREGDAASERVREMEKKRREREVQEKQAAELQRLAAENQSLKRILHVAPSAESTPPKAPKTRKSNSQRSAKVVNAVFAMWVRSIII